MCIYDSHWKQHSLIPQKPTEKKINPQNEQLIKNEQALWDRWRCLKPRHNGQFCYIKAPGANHKNIDITMFKVWAQAMVYTYNHALFELICFQTHGPDDATLEKPPNHHIFNKIPKRDNDSTKESPLLALQRVQMKGSSGSSTTPSSTAPIINYN
jgi:hypothetical protein